jgi:DNA-binding NtrC family response regulator
MNSSPAGTILVVDDDVQELRYLAGLVESLGYAVITAEDGEDALKRLEADLIDAIVTDIFMPRMDGMEFLKTLLERGDPTPAIVLTGFGSMERAISLVHDLHAFWFLEKPANKAALASLLDRALAHKSLLREAANLRRELGRRGVLGSMFGKSRAMQEIFALIQRVGPTVAPVLITGESGTGKELVARAIHATGNRATRPFVAVNCAAIPETLIESELFGHEKGAFTGAAGRHPGCFEQANGGTLFLDEIGEMPMPMQARLLRVLQDSRIRRLGGEAEITVDVRIIAATNRPIEESIREKQIREDLYYRLSVFNITLPPLRERLEDLPGISEMIIGELRGNHEYEVTGLHPLALERLKAHAWPGNVRELRNVLTRAVIVAGKGLIREDHLPPKLLVPQQDFAAPAPGRVVEMPASGKTRPDVTPPAGSFFAELGKDLSHVEKAYILSTLEITNQNRKQAAAILGISIRTLQTRLAEFAAEELRDSRALSATGEGETA